METRHEIETASEPAYKSPWVWGMVSILLLSLTANLFMVFFAYKTWGGLVTKDYYEDGQNYFVRKISEKAMRRELGWALELPGAFAPEQGKPNLLAVSVRCPSVCAGNPDAVRVFAYRPSDPSKDFALNLEKGGFEDYRASVVFPLKGNWDIVAEAKKGNSYVRIYRRIQVSGGAKKS